MLPDRVSNPGPLTYESGALPIALRGPANAFEQTKQPSCLSNQSNNEPMLIHASATPPLDFCAKSRM